MAKRILIFVLSLCLAVCFCTVALAQDVGELELYVKDRLVPVAFGVLTALVALGSTLVSVSKSLKGLRDAKDVLNSENESRGALSKRSMAEVSAGVKEMKAAVASIEDVAKDVAQLKEECVLIAKVLGVGFGASAEVVKSGRGREISGLLERAGVKNEEN